MIQYIKVNGKIVDLSEFSSDYDEAIICCPNASRENIYKIIEVCKNAGKPFRTLPSVNEVMSGKLSINQLKIYMHHAPIIKAIGTLQAIILHPEVIELSTQLLLIFTKETKKGLIN